MNEYRIVVSEQEVERGHTADERLVQTNVRNRFVGLGSKVTVEAYRIDLDGTETLVAGRYPSQLVPIGRGFWHHNARNGRSRY